jgi:hypothetical protein
MVKHTLLRRNPKLYEDFYCNQNGHGLPIFIGGRNQRGHGIGSFFSGLGRMVLPWLKTGGKALLREGVSTGLHVANDALAGRNVGESFKEHAKEAGHRLLQGAVQHIGQNQSGSGLRRKRALSRPPGEPLEKRIKLTHRPNHKHSKTCAKTKKKHPKYSDIFA